MSYTPPPGDACTSRRIIPTDATGARMPGEIVRTWRDDREAELRRREYLQKRVTGWPRPLPIVGTCR